MNYPFAAIHEFLAEQPALVRRERRPMIRILWFLALSLLIFELFWAETSSLLTNLSAVLITAAALLPSYLWCSGKALGSPIFPLFGLTFIWTYALPLVTNHPKILTYTPSSHWFASITTAGFLGLGTLCWFRFVKSVPPIPRTYRVLTEQKGDSLFLMILAVSVVFNIGTNGGWIFLLGSWFTAIRAAIIGLTALATFVLSNRLGTQELSKKQSSLLVGLLIASFITSTVGLLLVTAASTFLLGTIAFIIGRKKVPVLVISIALICLVVLHYGKSEMRAKYWGGQNNAVQIWNYPAWYSEWVGYSFSYFDHQANRSQSQEKQSFLERSSIIHLLLLAQDKSPTTVPYLNGATYAILPQLLVPRILNSNKIRSHEGTYLLNINYGLQTREATLSTTIGWGLLAESYANFGLLGCTGLAIVLGTSYGWVTRWAMNAPLLSAQSMFSVLIISFAFQTEFSAGVYVAALFQSSIVLLGIVVIFMKLQSSLESFQSVVDTL